MLNVLSIQTENLGHKVYGDSLRECFSRFDDITLHAFWAREGRDLPTRAINRLSEISIPGLGSRGRNLDLRRARVEWAQGQMGRKLIERELKKSDYDLLHLHTQLLAFGADVAMKRVPTVVSIDMTAYQVALEQRYPKSVLPNILMERRAFNLAQHIVTWSEWARNSVIRDHQIPDNKVTAISPGVRLKELKEVLFDEYEIPRILFVGSDFRRKGGWDLLDVFSEHFSQQAELHLVTHQQLGRVPKNVFVHYGILAYTEPWHNLFRNSHIFALPSYAEGLGLVFQEAAAYGLALIGSSLNAIPEMIHHEDNGMLVQPGDKRQLREAIAALLSNRTKLLSMRKKSRGLALRQFDADTNFRRLADLFQRQASKRVESGGR